MADIWGRIKGIVGASAPILGSAIIPGVGGTAGSLVAKMLDCNSSDPKVIEKQLINDPEISSKLKELETKHEQFLIRSSQETDKMYLDSIKDARAREIEYTKATGKTNWPIYILGGSIVVGFFASIACLFKFELMAVNKELVIYTIGGLQSAFITIVTYFYGSSKGSSDKNKILENNKVGNTLEK